MNEPHPESKKDFEVYPLILPDGSEYIQVLVNNSPSIQEIRSALRQIWIENPSQEVRLIFNNKNEAEEFLNLPYDGTMLKVHGRTNYFEIYPSEITELMDRLQKFANGFDYDHVAHMAYVPTEYADLMVNTFAQDAELKTIDPRKAQRIRSLVDTHSQFEVDNFLITDHGLACLGAFTLAYIGDEVQLHCVAGKPTGELANFPNKLSVIMYFVLLEASKFNKLITFSASGAAHLYRQHGIRESERFGVVVYPVVNP